jgi:hypothetical protein
LEIYIWKTFWDQALIGMQPSGTTKTTVHKGIFLVLFVTSMKNAEGRLDSSFLTSMCTHLSPCTLNFSKLQ